MHTSQLKSGPPEEEFWCIPASLLILHTRIKLIMCMHNNYSKHKLWVIINNSTNKWCKKMLYLSLHSFDCQLFEMLPTLKYLHTLAVFSVSFKVEFSKVPALGQAFYKWTSCLLINAVVRQIQRLRQRARLSASIVACFAIPFLEKLSTLSFLQFLRLAASRDFRAVC